MYIENDSDSELDSSYDENEDYNNSYYEPEEESITKFNIILCELYNKNIHGISSNSIIKYNYLTISKYKIIDRTIYRDAKYHNNRYNNYRNKKHDIFKNYKNIISSNNYIKPEIAQCIYLSNENECIAILKTFWLRLIQRTWKNIYQKRILLTKKRCCLNSLKYREIYGKWPDNCNEYPRLKGMLSFLTCHSA